MIISMKIKKLIIIIEGEMEKDDRNIFIWIKFIVMMTMMNESDGHGIEKKKTNRFFNKYFCSMSTLNCVRCIHIFKFSSQSVFMITSIIFYFLVNNSFYNWLRTIWTLFFVNIEWFELRFTNECTLVYN